MYPVQWDNVYKNLSSPTHIEAPTKIDTNDKTINKLSLNV